jgi:hypothetical protein
MNGLIEKASRLLEDRLDRRNFLGRTALVATAVAVAPKRFLLEPVTAQAAVCGCAGSSCDCGSQCCDGYTEFCCTLTGSNACPPGTLAAGWWKADGSPFCVANGVPQPRFYLDCNASCNGCGCGGSGICSPACARCGCGCAGGSCNHRRTCCVNFRYGQCHQEVACLGPILCRVVTCTPPWLVDGSCTTTVAVDNNTALHDAACLHVPPPPPKPPAPEMKLAQWYLTNSLASGVGQIALQYGQPGDMPVVGVWKVATPPPVPPATSPTGVGVVRGGTWYLRSMLTSGNADISFQYGQANDIPIVGDWNGDGIDGIGVVRGSTWYLRNALSSGVGDITLQYGQAGDTPVVGDWNGDGIDGIGIVRGSTWYLRNSLTSGVAEIVLDFGEPGDMPVVGDWNGDKIDGIGVKRGGTWYLRNTLTTGVAEMTINYGDASDIPLAGDWNGHGVDSLGVAR